MTNNMFLNQGFTIEEINTNLKNELKLNDQQCSEFLRCFEAGDTKGMTTVFATMTPDQIYSLIYTPSISFKNIHNKVQCDTAISLAHKIKDQGLVKFLFTQLKIASEARTTLREVDARMDKPLKSDVSRRMK